MVQKPTIAAFEGDSESLSIKKVEELYHYSQYVFDGEIERIKRIDTKISRYLAGSLVLLGFSATWTAKMVEAWSWPLGCLDWFLFVPAFLSLLGLWLGTFAFFLMLRFGPVDAPPAGKGQLDLLYAHAYVRVLVTLSLTMMEAATNNAAICQRKFRLAKLGYNSLTSSLILLLVAFISYVVKLILG